MQVLRAAGYRRMPWKNGGGETFEIAVSPTDASLESLGWRISMAIVASDGPFSIFPGIDRTLTLLDGAGMTLDFGAAQAPCTLTAESAPFAFAADLPVQARLVADAVTDLNVMTRRGSHRHVVRRLTIDGELELHSRADEMAVFCCAADSLTVTADGEPGQLLQSRDCAILAVTGKPLRLTGPRRAVVLIAEFYRTTATPG